MAKKEPSKQYLRLLAYLSGFFLTVHMAFPSYFNSKFIGQFVGVEELGIVYTIASLITIVCIVYTPRLIRKIGILRTATWLIIADALAIFPLPFVKSADLALGLFVLYYALGLVIRYTLDIYLEKVTDSRQEGDVRGVFLTFMNIAWLASPFLASRLLGTSGFAVLYFIAALSLLPLAYIVAFQLKEHESHRQVRTPQIRRAIWKLVTDKRPRMRNIYYILGADFLLNFFYAVMVIYMEPYLSKYVGLSDAGIGIAFTVMLLPFVLFELPLGHLADKYLGEKEILTAGFIMAGLATLAVPFVHSAVVWLWALVLFLTRTGAASIEIMKETYLFKKIGEEDTDILSISRNMQPITYIIGPALASVLIAYAGMPYVFLVLGFVTLGGIRYSLAIQDTK